MPVGSGRFATKALAYLLLAATSLFMVFPFLWMLSSSLKPFEEIFAGDTFLPQTWTLDNYTTLFDKFDALRKIGNSFFVASAFTTLAVFFSLGGYAFAKFDFPGRRVLFAFVLATLAIPFAVVIVPLFIMMRNTFHWIDTFWPLIVPGAANAFGIFFMRQYMLSIPDDLLDAARVDGASEFKIFWKVVVPLAVPGIASLGIIFFMASWNDFLWPLAVLRSDDKQTIPVMLNSLEGPPGRTAFDLLMAGSVISVLPLLVVFLVLQRRLFAGIMSGAVKA
jgi:ABC-type glycerol-3-phosphate transport system permease component